jgi:hypothetical protein
MKRFGFLLPSISILLAAYSCKVENNTIAPSETLVSQDIKAYNLIVNPTSPVSVNIRVDSAKWAESIGYLYGSGPLLFNPLSSPDSINRIFRLYDATSGVPLATLGPVATYKSGNYILLASGRSDSLGTQAPRISLIPKITQKPNDGSATVRLFHASPGRDTVIYVLNGIKIARLGYAQQSSPIAFYPGNNDRLLIRNSFGDTLVYSEGAIFTPNNNYVVPFIYSRQDMQLKNGKYHTQLLIAE